MPVTVQSSSLTERDIEQLKGDLSRSDVQVFTLPVDRSHNFYQVLTGNNEDGELEILINTLDFDTYVESILDSLHDLTQLRASKAIVYCRDPSQCDELFAFIDGYCGSRWPNRAVLYYGQAGGQSDEQALQAMAWWATGRAQVIIATVRFDLLPLTLVTISSADDLWLRD